MLFGSWAELGAVLRMRMSKFGVGQKAGVLVAGLGVLLAGCGPGNQNFLANGPGAQLEAHDTASAGALNRQYFNYLCKEAGISTPYEYSSPAGNCIINPSDQTSWTTITYQGLNDIDRRCDAYLQWLDNKKRGKGPILSQISTVGAATAGIMGFTGATAAAISIVAIAFELVSKSVENYHSRLLLEIESSTINTIVLNSRQQFRQHLLDENIQIANKPQSEHVLRSYLRLCLPFAIEANINNFSTLGSAGLAPDENNSINSLPVVAQPFVASTPTTTTIVRPDPPAPKIPWPTDGTTIDVAEGKAIQKALCFTGTGVDGDFGPKTDSALKIYKSFKASGSFGDTNWRQKNSTLTASDVSELRRIDGCSTGAKNYLENLILNNDRANERVVKALVDKYSATTTQSSFVELRSLIKRWREEAGLSNDADTNNPDGFFEDQITPDLYALIDPVV